MDKNLETKCGECGKVLTNEEDCYGHDCEVEEIK